MKAASKWTLIALALMLGASTSMAAVITNITFGSNNDGNGGFTADVAAIIPTPAPGWVLVPGAMSYTNGPTTDSGQVNGSLLNLFNLNRTAGNSYTFTGVLDLVSGYAADNNRVSMALFGNTSAVADIESTLGAHLNYGANSIQLRNGFAGTVLTNAVLSGVTGADLIGQELTYTIDVGFVGADMQIDFTLSAPVNSFSQTVSTTVAAASYTGEYFGFATRARVRNTTPGVNDIAQVYDIKTFTIEQIPEPSTFSMVAIMGGALFFVRRRIRISRRID